MTDEFIKTGKSRRIVEIGVLGLFGLYDHAVKLNQQERITILHGPNGVGKTVLLEMIRDFRNGTLSKFRTTPFDEFYVRYDDDQISYVRPHEHASPSHTLNVALNDGIEGIISVGAQMILSEKNIDGNVYFIGVDRVVAQPKKQKNNQVKAISRVQDCSDQLKIHMSTALTQYAQMAQKLDQSFPQRLISATSFAGSVDELKAAFASISEQRQRYLTIGLLGGSDTSTPFDTTAIEKLDASSYSTLALYVADTRHKLGMLEPFAKRLETLLSIINSRFKNKVLSVSLEEGLQFHHRAQKLNLPALSSGEQHLLVILYDLLFSVSPNTLVLIDEPELSWHISWQRQFLDDLFAIIRLSQLDIVLATHSPDIIGDRSDLMVSLSAEPTKQYRDAA